MSDCQWYLGAPTLTPHGPPVRQAFGPPGGTAMKIRRILAAAVLTVSVGGALSVSPASAAKPCKWAVISYDPATHTSIVACVGGNRP